MSQFNLSTIKRSQLIIIPSMLAAYNMGNKDTFLGVNSDLVFFIMLAIVVINLIVECREISKKD